MLTDLVALKPNPPPFDKKSIILAADFLLMSQLVG